MNVGSTAPGSTWETLAAKWWPGGPLSKDPSREEAAASNHHQGVRGPWESVKFRDGQMWQGTNKGSQAFGYVVRSCGWNEPMTADRDHTSQGSEDPAKLTKISAEPLLGLLITFLSCIPLCQHMCLWALIFALENNVSYCLPSLKTVYWM